MRRAGPSRTCRGRDASLRGASIGQRLARDAKAWSESTTRTQIRARVGCRARTHALAGGVQMGWRGFLLRLCPRAASSLPGRHGIWRRTGGRRVYDRTQTVTAACSPLGETPIVSHSRKEGTVAVPTHASDVGWFPYSPPPFPPVALYRAFAVRVVVAIHAAQLRSHGGAVSSPGHSHACIRDSSRKLNGSRTSSNTSHINKTSNFC